MSDAERIAKELSLSARLALTDGCGCDVHDEMIERGLWQPEPGVGHPYYLTTDLGKAVRAILQEHRDG